VCVDEDIFLADIEKLIKRSIPREVVPGFERSQHERAEPIVLGRMTIGVGASRGGRSGGGGQRGRNPAPPARRDAAPQAARRDAPRPASGSPAPQRRADGSRPAPRLTTPKR